MKGRKTLVVWESMESSNPKNWDIGSGNVSQLNFFKLFRSYKKNRNVVNNWNRFKQVGSLF